MSEPKITINGTELTEGQAMTVRVAANHLASELMHDGLGNDAHGQRMTTLYLARLGELVVLMNPSFKDSNPCG